MDNAQACKICEIPFASKKLAYQHTLAAHHFSCYLCGKEFNTVNRLDDHFIDVHNTTMNHTCRICGLNLQRRKWLIDHMNEHVTWERLLGPLVFKCQVCNAKCLEEKELRDHEKTHNKEWNSEVSKEKSFGRLKAPKRKRNRYN